MDIQTLEIVRKANRLTNELGTNDPHKIARELGIEVIPLSFKKQRGAYKVLMRNRFMSKKERLYLYKRRSAPCNGAYRNAARDRTRRIT